MQDAGIIRNRLKLRAARQNAQAWLRQDDPVALVWSFVGGQPLIHHYEKHEDIPLITPEAENMSRALRKAGFTFVGPTICQSYLQAIGAIMDHTTDCFRYRQLR
jgi:DNA-3-methyladenine glycosylase I